MKGRDKQDEEDVRRLREFAAFADFSDDDLRRLVRAAHRTSTSAPWPLIHEQTPSDACFILLSGEASVYLGRERVADLAPAEVLRIGRDDFARLLDEIPALRGTVDDTVARHTSNTPATD